MDRHKKILIVAGTTGGHFFPGLDLALRLRTENREVLLIVDRKKRIPVSITPDLPVVFFPGQGFPGWFSWRLIPFGIGLFFNILRATCLIRREKIALVVGMGSYLAYPFGVAAFLCRIPLILHEQNTIPGLTNRLLSPLARWVGIGLPLSRPLFPAEKTVLCGNPIRQSFRRYSPEDGRQYFNLDPACFTLFITGGSQGAHFLNQEIPVLLDRLAQKEIVRFQVIHLTGEKDCSAVKDFYIREEITARVYPFLELIDRAYSAANLVICRSGALTISELIFFQKPAILVPLLGLPGEHQLRNAEYLKKAGVAQIILPDPNFDRSLLLTLEEIFQKPVLLTDTAERFIHLTVQYQKDFVDVIKETLSFA